MYYNEGMKEVLLGKTGIKVSELGLGSLTMGGLQKGFTPEQIRPVVRAAHEVGINFVDAAELYDSYAVVKELLALNPHAVVASKSYAYDKKGAEKALMDALKAIGRDYIDIFLLHETEDLLTIRGHEEAWRYYLSMQEKGVIRAVGISTHRVAGVRGAMRYPELQIVHPLINHRGFGLFDGTREEMEAALMDAEAQGKGIYAMKLFGGGHLLSDREAAVKYFKEKSYLHAAVVGMQSPDEVHCNAALFEGKKTPLPPIQGKKVVIQDWCVKCLSCAKKCPQNAIQKVGETVIIDEERCVLCGYCGSACPELAIKIF